MFFEFTMWFGVGVFLTRHRECCVTLNYTLVYDCELTWRKAIRARTNQTLGSNVEGYDL